MSEALAPLRTARLSLAPSRPDAVGAPASAHAFTIEASSSPVGDAWIDRGTLTIRLRRGEDRALVAEAAGALTGWALATLGLDRLELHLEEAVADPEVSVVIPVRDEAANLPELIARLTATLEPLGAHELVFVTDLNTDDTMEVLRRAHVADARVKVIKLSNGFGQHVAALAGLDVARGREVVLMDGDLQDHPEDIPKLRARLREGFDVVYAIKERKNDSPVRNLLSRWFVRVLNWLSDEQIQHNTSMFRIMSRRTVDALLRFRERDQSLTGLTSLINFPTDKVLVTSGQRKAGETKYSLLRQVNLAIGFLLSFSTKPLRLFSIAGLLVSGVSFLVLFHTLTVALWRGVPVAGWTTIVALMSFLGGVQMLSAGVLGEYVGRIFLASKRRPLYIVEESIGLPEPRRGDPER